MFDIIIIGGNLAGASAAINASLRNVNIALVERNEKPFNPAHCGEGIADLTGQWFNLEKIKCPYNKINQTNIKLGSKEFILKMKKYNMVVFERNFIENKLIEKLEKIGIILFIGKKMKDFKYPNEIILESNEKIKGKIIIDASGIACQVGRRIGICQKLKPEDIGVCIQSIVHGNYEPNVMKFWHLEPFAPFGYAWLFPKNEKMANIGLGIKGGVKQDLNKLLTSYISYVNNGKYKILNTFKSCLPQAPPINTLVKDNVMIVGDAARLVHASSGAGIGNAIFSGSLAGIIAARYICNELPSIEIYKDAMNYKIKRLIKAYNEKYKAIKNEKMYLKIFGRGLSLFQFLNKFFPSLSEKLIAINLEKDKKTLESFKGTANLL